MLKTIFLSLLTASALALAACQSTSVLRRRASANAPADPNIKVSGYVQSGGTFNPPPIPPRSL